MAAILLSTCWAFIRQRPSFSGCKVHAANGRSLPRPHVTLLGLLKFLTGLGASYYFRFGPLLILLNKASDNHSSAYLKRTGIKMSLWQRMRMTRKDAKANPNAY